MHQSLEKYLASGMVKGIGPIYAKRLIARFGEELFEVIEKTPNSLEQIEGIGPKRKLKIVNAWSDQRFWCKLGQFGWIAIMAWNDGS